MEPNRILENKISDRFEELRYGSLGHCSSLISHSPSKIDSQKDYSRFRYRTNWLYICENVGVTQKAYNIWVEDMYPSSYSLLEVFGYVWYVIKRKNSGRIVNAFMVKIQHEEGVNCLPEDSITMNTRRRKKKG